MMKPNLNEIIDTFDGAKPRFLNRGLVPLSINPEHTPGACPERSRRVRPGSRMG